MRSLVPKALLFLGTALCINILCVNAASADSATYVYRGNNFTDIQGEPGVFSTKDRVTGHFTVNCSIAHPEGTCANLPYDNYFWMGAVTLESVELSAGPASLPTDDGHADVNAFWFSTDSNGQIVFWDIELSLWALPMLTTTPEYGGKLVVPACVRHLFLEIKAAHMEMMSVQTSARISRTVNVALIFTLRKTTM